MDAESAEILVVDDNRDIAETLAMLLQFEGHQTFVAYDATAGLRLAAEVVPDIVFHDIALPDISGYDAARALRQNPKFLKTILVAHTGFTADAERRRASESGFDYHLGKPLDPLILKALLNAAGEISRQAAATIRTVDRVWSTFN